MQDVVVLHRILHELMTDHIGANLYEDLIAVGVVIVIVAVDGVADRLVRNELEILEEGTRTGRCGVGVHNEHISIAHDDRAVAAARTGCVIDALAHLLEPGYFPLRSRIRRRRRCTALRKRVASQPRRGSDRGERCEHPHSHLTPPGTGWLMVWRTRRV